jgi:hypothetical protein
MISIAKVQLSSHPSPQTVPEITHELDISIRSDGPRNVMQMNHLIEVKLGYPRCLHDLLASYKMNHL